MTARPARTKQPETLAEFVKTRRIELGLSLQKLAGRVGCSKAHIWEIEQGISSNPKTKLVCALAAGLQVTAIELFRIAAELELDAP